MVYQLLKGIFNSRLLRKEALNWRPMTSASDVFTLKGLVFNLPCLTMSVRTGKNLKQSFHASFPEDKNLCVVECLREYESRPREYEI